VAGRLKRDGVTFMGSESETESELGSDEDEDDSGDSDDSEKQARKEAKALAAEEYDDFNPIAIVFEAPRKGGGRKNNRARPKSRLDALKAEEAAAAKRTPEETVRVCTCCTCLVGASIFKVLYLLGRFLFFPMMYYPLSWFHLYSRLLRACFLSSCTLIQYHLESQEALEALRARAAARHKAQVVRRAQKLRQQQQRVQARKAHALERQALRTRLSLCFNATLFRSVVRGFNLLTWFLSFPMVI